MTNRTQFKWGDVVVPRGNFTKYDRYKRSETLICLGEVRSRPGQYHAIGKNRSTNVEISTDNYKKVGNITEDTDYEW